MKDLLLTDYPLWLPAGSVRAVIALGVVGAYIAGAVEENIVILVLAFYFADRSSASE